MVTLVPEQTTAVEQPPSSAFLLVAGAGSGKTTTIAERVGWLVDKGAARPDQILALTFTNKAAVHLTAAILDRLSHSGMGHSGMGAPDVDVAVGTYHGFAASLVADHLVELDLDPRTEVLNRAQAWQLLFSVLDDLHFDRRKTFAPGILLNDVLALASRCADYLVPVESLMADSERIMEVGRWKMKDKAAERLELCRAIAAYQRRKRERHLIDFGDQIALAVHLVDAHPELARGWREAHPFLLLDEYQDTNFAQRRLLQLLYPPGSSVTAVGDDMQSIYAFRGAHLGNLLGFRRHFPPADKLELQTTFRFGRRLADLANRMQAQVPGALEKELVPAGTAPDTTIACFLASDDAGEAEAIADDIARRGAAWSGNAVLCRKRRLIPPIAAALEARHVPVAVIGASGLLDRPEVVDVVAWLEIVADPSASVALLRVLQGPRFRLSLGEVAALGRHAPADLAGAIAEAEKIDGLGVEARTRLAEFGAEHEQLTAAAQRLPVVDLAETVIDHMGLWHAAGEVGRDNLLRFLDLAERFRPVQGDPGLAAFLEHVRLLDESEEDIAEARLTDRDAVTVMTIHQAKGLEFPYVYVPGLAGKGASRIFPDIRGGDNPLTTGAALPWWAREDDEGFPDWTTAGSESEVADELRARKRAEEWRLFYVACTRAQRQLVCSAAHWYPGSADPQGPSEFYEFVAAQDGIVTEWFRHEPAADNPEVAAKQRQRQTLERRRREIVATAPLQLSLAGADVRPQPTRPSPTELSVTGLVTYARCPKRFYWEVVRPLPRRSSEAARIGTEVHRWIEGRSKRQLVLLEPDADRVPHEPGVVARLQQSFLTSPYADLEPLRVEAPFVLVVGRHLIRGRIDAVYERDGFLELVDFKTGRPAADDDPARNVQLDLYALAAAETWRTDPGRLRTTYCHLSADGPAELVTSDWAADQLDAVRDRLRALLDGLTAARFPTVTGRWCQHCDFLTFCAPGRAYADAAHGGRDPEDPGARRQE